MSENKFRKRPIVIDAVQWDASTVTWNKIMELGCPWKVFPSFGSNKFIIPTLEGDMTVDEFDWVIKGINGEFYPCKADIFEKTYEPADESPSTPPLTEEREKVLRWVKVGERLPKEKKCFCVRWLDDDENPAILGACIFNMWDNGEFDVSDDDDLDPKNPRGTQPDEWLEETEHPSPSPQTEHHELDLNLVKENGGINGGSVDEDDFTLRLPTQTEERGELPDEPFDFDGWVNEKFDERGRYKQTLDEWSHYKCGVVDLYNDIEPVNKSLRKEISVLQSQLSETIKERDTYKKILDEYGKV